MRSKRRLYRAARDRKEAPELRKPQRDEDVERLVDTLEREWSAPADRASAS